MLKEYFPYSARTLYKEATPIAAIYRSSNLAEYCGLALIKL